MEQASQLGGTEQSWKIITSESRGRRWKHLLLKAFAQLELASSQVVDARDI